jgi:hypothetical protein
VSGTLPLQRTALAALWTCGALLWASPAAADIAVHDGGVERDVEVGELVTRRTGQKPRMVLSGDVLAGPTRLLASNLTVEECAGAPIELALAGKLDGVVEAVLSFELERAVSELDVLETLLPCASAPVSATELAKVSFLRGAAMLDMGDEEAARVSMADALAQDPAFEGLKGFPKPHTDLLASLATAESKATRRLYVWNKEGAVTDVLVDGVGIPEPDVRGATVAPGRHLVQARAADGSLRGMWVRSGDVDSVIIQPGAGRGVWADGGHSPGGEMAMRLLLLSEFQGRDGDVHVLRFKGRRIVSAVTYPADGGVQQPWERGGGAGGGSADTGTPEPGSDRATDAPRGARSGATKRAGSIRPSRVRIAIGGGYQYVHPFNYGMVSADLGVRLVGPLTLSAFARPSFGGRFTVDLGESEPVQGAIVLVPFGLGVGLQKHDGPIGPFVFASFHAAPNQVIPLGALLVGAAVQGGADFAPGDGPFIVRVEGEAGFLGASDDSTGMFFAGVVGRISVGVGARF